ncbi:CPXV166 protein, partial [Monkeypox virus]
DDDD